MQCPTPENPKNGKAIFTSTSYNSVVSYECRYGYTLIGENSRRCGADKKWSGSIPSCREINCGHPGTLYNGWLENTEGGFGLGASIISRCHSDMLLHGNASTVCQIDGRWRYPLPACLAPCVVPSVSQGIVVPIEGEPIDTNGTTVPSIIGLGSNKVRHGTTLDVVCDENYEFPYTSQSPPTCNNGTWSTIPRCVPARCKALPRPPKFGMVISPKTEHGMKARFKCKDGWQLTTPQGKPITDPTTENVLTCLFGNWTGETPVCQEVYCAFPGTIENGKVFLVGNMGLYDYRPYVKKVINNKQIMYDCDKGYILENGPVSSGATCVGGKWSPAELPKCLPGQHPRLRWNRKKRSLDLRKARGKFLLNHYRNIKRQHFDHQVLESFVRDASKREKRSINKRDSRDYSEIDRAYVKYYESIKEKYRQYVKSLFASQKMRAHSQINHHHKNNNTQNNENSRKILTNDGRWFNHNNPEFRYRANNKARTFTFDQTNDDEKEELPPVALPSINDRIKSNRKTSKQVNITVSNYYPSYYNHHDKHEEPERKISNTTDLLLAQLQADVVRRRKRETDDDGKSDDDGPEIGGKKKHRGPCESLANEEHMQIEIVKPPKIQNETNGHGIVLKITCDTGFNLNVQTANSTVRCNKGVWKPMRPSCSLRSCFVPSIEHGKYFDLIESANDTSKLSQNTTAFTPMETVNHGQTIVFNCDTGYNIQGPNLSTCNDGNFSNTVLPECLPAPCVLPEILHAVYQGGYRSGLTIAHGSHVMVLCDNGNSNTNLIPPTQMDCALGSLTPSTVSCSFTSVKKAKDDEESANIIIDDGNSTNSIEEDECAPPSRELMMLFYNKEETDEVKEETPDAEPEIYPSGTEISFNCIASITGDRATWKLICENGKWIGRAHDCIDDERLYSSPHANGSCIYKNTDQAVASFYNDQEIRENYVEFPAGTVIISRSDVFYFTLY